MSSDSCRVRYDTYPIDSSRQQIAALREQIREHDRRYYVDAAPTISDREYDKLLARAEASWKRRIRS